MGSLHLLLKKETGDELLARTAVWFIPPNLVGREKAHNMQSRHRLVTPQSRKLGKKGSHCLLGWSPRKLYDPCRRKTLRVLKGRFALGV